MTSRVLVAIEDGGREIGGDGDGDGDGVYIVEFWNL